MDESTKRKLEAAGKIGFGALKITSGALTFTGHGLMYAIAKKGGVHNNVIARYAGERLTTGLKDVKKGLEDWQDS